MYFIPFGINYDLKSSIFLPAFDLRDPKANPVEFSKVWEAFNNIWLALRSSICWIFLDVLRLGVS